MGFSVKPEAARQQILLSLANGPKPTTELRGLLGNPSRATLSRLVSSLNDQVLVLGQSKATHYARPRDIRGAGSHFPLYRIDSEGNARRFGELWSILGGFFWQPSDSREKIFRYLPWFIQDMRPDGFMGRAYAQRVGPILGLPPRLPDWHDDHVLVALARRGEDVIGDLVVGEESLGRYLEGSRLDPVLSTVEDYPELARKALAGDPAGSSAGGEQPKFHALIERDSNLVHVMVKFSPLLSTEEGERWGDLLVCEHLALQIVAEAGITAAKSNILTTDGRTFLEVERFDRTGPFGRLPLHSLGVIDDEFFGNRDNWTAMAERMERAGMLSKPDAETLVWLDAFGVTIANTDRHFGNISVVPTNDERTKFRLAPAYDMLPMFYRPRQGGELPVTPYTPVPIVTLKVNVIGSAENSAREFWSRAANDTRITSEFRAVCKENLGKLERTRKGPRLIL